MKKYFLHIAMVLFSVSVLLFSTSQVKATETEGTCGKNLTWSFDLETGDLVIDGTGKMSIWKSPPWRDFEEQIKRVVLSEGVESIANFAFAFCSLEEIEIPESVTEIGRGAFESSLLKK